MKTKNHRTSGDFSMIGQQQAILIIPHLLPLFLNWSSVSEANPSSETGPLLVSFVLAFGYSPQLAAISA